MQYCVLVLDILNQSEMLETKDNVYNQTDSFRSGILSRAFLCYYCVINNVL